MATDKSLNIRQVRAAEVTASAIDEMRQRFEVIQSTLDDLEAQIAEIRQALAPKPEPAKPEAGKAAANKK